MISAVQVCLNKSIGVSKEEPFIVIKAVPLCIGVLPATLEAIFFICHCFPVYTL